MTTPIKIPLPYVLIGAGLIGGLASLVLTYDTIQLLHDSTYVPPCNLNPIISCGSIMKSSQANIIGIPNSILGLAAFSALLTFGVMLAGGAKLQRWVWLFIQAVATIGVVFMHYLFFQAVFELGTICPWCFIIWMVTIPTFWSITVHTIQQRYIRPPTFVARCVQKYHRDILAIWYLLIGGILLLRFWDFWVTLL